MSHSNQWYPPNNNNNQRDDRQRRPQDPNATHPQGPGLDVVRNGQRLLAVYPPASATPTHHVSRHIGSMTLTAAPTFPQPSFTYNASSTAYSHRNPAPYANYDQQLRYLAHPQAPSHDTGFWENTRNDSVRMLNEQAGPSYQYQEPTHWAPPAPQSSFQTPAFAQSIFHRTTNNIFPAAPPAPLNSSSSSLAFALGPPPTQTQPQAQTQYQPPPPPLQQQQQHQHQPQHHIQNQLPHFHPQINSQSQAHYQTQPQPQPQYQSSSNLNVQFQQHQSHVRPPAKEYPPQESQAFFDNFVERKFQRISPPPPPIFTQPPERKERQPQQANPPTPNVNQPPERKERKSQQVDPPPPPIVSQPVERKERKLQQTNPLPPAVASQPIVRKAERSITPPKPMMLALESSPDPLALHSEAFSVTPKKRKPVITMESPSIKRIQSLKGTHRALSNERDTPGKTTPRAAAAIPLTPTTNSSSFSLKLSDTSFNHVTPTHKRIVNKAYVAVPPSPWSTPASIRKMNGANGQWQSSDDLGGYGSQDDGLQSPTKRSINDSVKSSARRTGDRDERGPLEKLTSLIEDVFEAEDTLPSEMDPSDLNYDFFSPLSSDLTRPMLNVSVIRKLTKYIGHVARPTKRLRQATGGVLGTPRAKGRMADVDTQMLSRLLKFLERSVKEGEDLDPFAYHGAVAASIKSSPKKPSTKKAAAKAQKGDRPRSNTPRGTEDADVEEASVAESRASHAVGPEDEDFEQLASQLDVALESILAADCCIALLASDRLTKQLYSEELITACLNTIKNQLTKILYPFVEASTEGGVALNISPLLQSIVKNSHSMASPNRRQLNELFVALSAVIPRINNLVNAEAVAMSDSIIIQAVYIAIGPFFVVDPGSETDTKGKKENVVIKTLGKTAMRGLRLDALSLIRSIFANHEDQRSWIIEEILSSLIKLNDTKQKAGQYRLRDGRSIRTVSALLLQLVQTSAHDVRLDAKKFEKIRQNKFALKRQESYTETQPAPLEPFLDETDQEEIRLYGTGLDSATKAAKSIIIFLTQRSGKGKATKNSNEAEYRMIFDNLIDDLLTVLFWPEWPAAGLILSIASKFMVSSLDDVKTNAQTDSNAAKTMALDHLGVIAARIRTSVLKVQNDPPSKKGLRPLDDIVASINLKYLNRFLDAHRDIAAHLCKRSSEDQAYDSARELTAATLGQELANALKHVNNCLQNPEADDDGVAKDPAFLDAFGQRLKISLRELWKEPATDIFDIGSQDEVARIDGLAEEIGTIQSLRNSFNPILSVILMALDAPAIFMRTKALRALGQIVTSDASILAMPSVRRGIESHLLDNSPAVRDAAVELIGKYMIDSPAVAGDYYQKIADRMADTGLSVRKRVIKLLKSFYLITDDTHRIDIALRMVLRMMDEDDTVKDLAIKTIEELWFPALPLPSAMKGRASTTNPQDHAALLSKVSVIMGTSAHFKDARQSPLEDVLHKIMGDKEGNEKNSLHARYAEICEALIDGLVDASDLPGFTVSNCIRTIYLLTSAYPSILSSTNASTLLPYLKNAGEESTSDYLLKIFKVSIPHMPKTAAKFGQELQAALQPMIIKPSGAGGVQTLQETVGCMCVVVQHLTHDFVRLVNLLKSCNGRLQQTIKSNKEIGPNDIRALIILIFIVSLLAEHCNFDNLRNENPSVAGPLNDISQGSIHEHVYNTLLTLYEKHDNATLRGRILQCLGFLFRAHPTLMTMDRSALIMDEIFASAEEEGKGRLLRIIQDFLVSEASKHSAKEKEMTKSKSKPNDVNMDELVGNTDGFADSGVSSAIVQRYLDHVLEAALSQNVQIQAVAIDVLSFTIKQGLAHPLQSFPVIVALETSPTASISNRASALHAILQGKHSSLLNTRYTVSARKSFDYQKRISPDSVRGFRMQPMPIALLQRWYSHIREKRPTRQDFLKSLVKIFQENPSYESSQDDVNYTRYMAENFSAFDYKTQEEVLTVIKYLTSVLSTTGMQLLEIISPSHLLTHLHAPSQSQSIPPSQLQPFPVGEVPDLPPVEPMDVVLSEHTKQTHNQVALMRTSVIIAVVMLLKAHLKALYSLSEDKCNKFVIGKKSAIGDKPATKRHDNPISWDRLPFATNSLHTTQDASLQKARFLEIWNEDGLTAEPEDEEFL